MKKRNFYALLLVCVILFTECSRRKEITGTLRDFVFTVIEEADAPKELRDEINKKKEKTFQISYADEGYLYIAKGYGSRETSGYSVEVKECYEAEDAVCVGLNLLGPDKSEDILEKETYPYVIIKMEYSDKEVVFH